jgi:hypothetical protein
MNQVLKSPLNRIPSVQDPFDLTCNIDFGGSITMDTVRTR